MYTNRGEHSLIASATRRNKGTTQRVKLGQKTDGIGLLRSNNLEIFLMESSAPGQQQYGTKAKKDKSKIMRGMKDALNRILLESFMTAERQDLERIFVIGVQIVGM